MSSNSWAGGEEQIPWLLSPATSAAILPLVQPVAGFGATTCAILWTRGALHSCCVSVPALVLQRCRLEVSHFTRRRWRCALRTLWDLWTEREGERITSAACKPRKRHWKSRSYKLNVNICLWELSALSIIGIFALEAAQLCLWGGRAVRISEGTVWASELQETKMCVSQAFVATLTSC